MPIKVTTEDLTSGEQHNNRKSTTSKTWMVSSWLLSLSGIPENKPGFRRLF